MKPTLLFLCISAFVTWMVHADEKKPDKPATTRPVVVVELFTSEGCSSCPPADKVLSDLAIVGLVDGVEVIPLALHVDYWNRLGWVDPFSSAKFTQRQEAYARSFRSDQIYTPQMVVDGIVQFIGSDKVQAMKAVRTAAQQPKGRIALRLTVPKADEQKLSVSVTVTDLPVVTPGDEAEVFMAVTEDALRSDVARGENAGQQLSHTGVVRQWQLAGKMSADRTPAFDRTGEVILREGWRRENLNVVVMVQERTSRRVLAAAIVSVAKH